MTELTPGLYEQLITRAIEDRLRVVPDRLAVARAKLPTEEAADRLALHLGRQLRQALTALDPKQRVALGVALAQRIIGVLEELDGAGIDATDRLACDGEMLRAVLQRLPSGDPEPLALPATPLLDTTLLTNAPGEPRVGFQLQSEIPSADRIDVLMAFVRQTGIQPLLPLLERHIARQSAPASADYDLHRLYRVAGAGSSRPPAQTPADLHKD